MYSSHADQRLQMETTCTSLLSDLQKIWDEVGQTDSERDKMLFELEQECLDAYKRKVDQANRSRAQLRKAVADAEAQLADICAALEDSPVHIKKSSGSLRKELQAIMPQLEDMKRKKNERMSQFAEVLKQINSITMELSGSMEENIGSMVIDESDLSMKRLDDLRNQLLLLQKEKDERLKQLNDLLNVLNGLCMVLGMDFKSSVCGVHPSFNDSSGNMNISADVIQHLSAEICTLKNVKLQRMQKLQDLAMTMLELWTLMDTPEEEQQMFQNVTRNIAAAEHEITEPNSLCLDIINEAEAEVFRLQEMKMSKIKEVLLKKRLVLEEVCQGAHMLVDGHLEEDLSVESIESGAISPSYLLEELEAHISKVKEEAFSRKEILEKVQKWLAACEEESWLEEYNRDDNRYNAGRGAHLILKRAEKARVIVNKIPAMVDALKSKANAWEQERNTEFLYDGVGLISMIDQYCELKLLKEQESKKQRDLKKLHGQLMTEQEAIFGSKPSPSKSGIKNGRLSTVGTANNRFSVGGAALQNKLDKAAGSTRPLQMNNTVKRRISQSHHNSGFVAPHSSGKKGMTGGPVKQHSNNSSNSRHQPASPSMLRKALSPLSSLCSNIISFNQDQNIKGSEFQDTQTGYKTPTKSVSGNDENRTPKTMPVPLPGTPPTVSNAMQTATTPFTPGIRRTEEVEYSCEERRAGFVIHSSHSKVLSLV
ncbi:hypothetical protein ACS0TY_003547 [Phlomoides rotata]